MPLPPPPAHLSPRIFHLRAFLKRTRRLIDIPVLRPLYSTPPSVDGSAAVHLDSAHRDEFNMYTHTRVSNLLTLPFFRIILVHSFRHLFISRADAFVLREQCQVVFAVVAKDPLLLCRQLVKAQVGRGGDARHPNWFNKAYQMQPHDVLAACIRGRRQGNLDSLVVTAAAFSYVRQANIFHMIHYVCYKYGYKWVGGYEGNGWWVRLAGRAVCAPSYLPTVAGEDPGGHVIRKGSASSPNGEHGQGARTRRRVRAVGGGLVLSVSWVWLRRARLRTFRAHGRVGAPPPQGLVVVGGVGGGLGRQIGGGRGGGRGQEGHETLLTLLALFY
ncbi:hypothetical protein BD626DRAFT_587611 [Schizophyllum amplum]|uniref:Uncharacterized protein n=1 Tax=Schizophyllum amplum TaxID=97359 RepID=A0A550BTQ6_9AGAR|nr:hypothetical protein BD626DRAFT_587611 [Auriculariopsis ampla]